MYVSTFILDFLVTKRIINHQSVRFYTMVNVTFLIKRNKRIKETIEKETHSLSTVVRISDMVYYRKSRFIDLKNCYRSCTHLFHQFCPFVTIKRY